DARTARAARRAVLGAARGLGADPGGRARARGRDDDRARARDRGQERRATGANDALRHARLRVPPRRRAADELPPASLDAARARDGLRRDRGDAAALPARDRGALSLLLVRGRDAPALKPRREWAVGELEEPWLD